MLNLAVSLPSKELAHDAAKIKDFIQGAEALGYGQVNVGEHVIGADIKNRPDWDLPNTIEGYQRDPFTILAFLAACTRHMLLVTSVAILPQRSSVHVAKQAADIDLLSGGRLRLGVGVGRYPLEYESVGQDYKNRGNRIIEQVALMRALWTEQVVTFDGKYEKVIEQGINPLPVQRPIPIWLGGGGVESVLKRIAIIADGWLVTPLAIEGGIAGGIERYKRYATEAGKDVSKLPIMGTSSAGKGTPDDWRADYNRWQSAGATILSINSSGAGETPSALIDALRRYKEAVS